MNPGIALHHRPNPNVLFGTFLCTNSSLPQNHFPATFPSKPVSQWLVWGASSHTQSICNSSSEIPQCFTTPKVSPRTQHKAAWNPSSFSLSSASFKSEILVVFWESQMRGDCPSSMQQKGTASYPNTLQSYLPRSGSRFNTHKATILKMYHARSETTQTGMFCCKSVIQKENNPTPTVQHPGLSPLCYGTAATQELLKTANYRLICTSQQHLQSAIRKPIFKLPALTILILISLWLANKTKQLAIPFASIWQAAR